MLIVMEIILEDKQFSHESLCIKTLNIIIYSIIIQYMSFRNIKIHISDK